MKKRTEQIIEFLVLCILSMVVFISILVGSFLLISLASLIIINYSISNYPYFSFSFLDTLFIFITIIIIPFYIAIKIHKIVPIPKSPFIKK